MTWLVGCGFVGRIRRLSGGIVALVLRSSSVIAMLKVVSMGHYRFGSHLSAPVKEI